MMSPELQAHLIDSLQNRFAELAARVEALEKEIIELKKDKR